MLAMLTFSLLDSLESAASQFPVKRRYTARNVRCHDYRLMGVATMWIIDPTTRTGANVQRRQLDRNPADGSTRHRNLRRARRSFFQPDPLVWERPRTVIGH